MFKKGKMITFEAMDEFTGKKIELTGKVIGHSKELRKRYPSEWGEAEDPIYLVNRAIKAIMKLKEVEVRWREKVKRFKKGSKNYRKARKRISEANYQIRLREKS